MTQRVIGFSFVLTLVGMISSAPPAQAAHSLAASWIVTYYLDPYGNTGSSQCINFKKTGEVNGVITGTWKSPTLPGWNGQWVQKGQHYSWYGTYPQSGTTVASFDVGEIINPNVTAESSIGTFTAGSKPTTLTTGTATMTQVQSCAAMPVRRSTNPTTNF